MSASNSPFGLALPRSLPISGPSSAPTSYPSSENGQTTNQSPLTNHGLALPISNPNGIKKKKRPRPKSGVPSGGGGSGSASTSAAGGINLHRELDELDDVSLDDLVAVRKENGRRGRRIDEDYDEDEEDDEEEEDQEEEEEEEENGRGEEDPDADGEEVDGDEVKDGGLPITTPGKRKRETEIVDPARITPGRSKQLRDQDGPATHTLHRDRLGEVVLDGKEIERRNKKRREETYLLRSYLDPEQAKRFDTFQNVVLPKGAIKKLNREIHDQACPVNLAAILGGLGKVFIAEVIEAAKEIQPRTADPTGPLRPYHLRLAREFLAEKGLVASAQTGKGLADMGGNEKSILRPKKTLFKR